eukprot:11177545-Lingulodinium_polyedra.AAC.1
MVFKWRARRVLFASCCNVKWSIRAHVCAAFDKRYTNMRSNPPFAVTAARKSHARALHANTK